MFKKIKSANYHFRHKEFDMVSPECKDLIQKLLVVDPRKRLSGPDAIKHPWFSKMKSSEVD